MNKPLIVFLVLYTALIVGLWSWWMQPDPVHFNEPIQWEEQDDTPVLPMLKDR